VERRVHRTAIIMATKLKPDLPRLGQPRIVTVPRTTYLSLSGTGLATTGETAAQKDLQAAIAALYSLAYTMKFARKKDAKAKELMIGPIEADWWVPGTDQPAGVPPEKWRWQLFLPVPGATSRELVAAMKTLMFRGRSSALTATAEVVTLPSTRCAEALHVGPYDKEGPTIEAMLLFAADKGWKITGRHREIYLGDPRRTAPSRLKTVLRHPVVKA
jgi:hypothetical protein